MSSVSAEYKKLLELKSSGKYVPPAKLKELQDEIKQSLKTSNEEYQKIQWEALKKSINRQINKLNKSNIKDVVVELFKLNLIRGKGILIRSIMKSQLIDSIFTPIYASLISILNSKILEIGDLLGKRLVLQFRKNYIKNNKNICISSTNFLCHLINQRVISDILILQILQLLLENPTNDSIEISIEILMVVGNFLTENSKAAMNMIFNKLRDILHENQELSERNRFLIENLFKIRKSQFKDYPTIEKGLDLVEIEDQQTHDIELDDKFNSFDELNIFQYDANYDENEKKYDEIKKDVLGDSDEEEEEDDEEEDEDQVQEIVEIKDMTESNLLNYQKTVYLTIMSSMSSDEAVHKLIRLNFDKSLEEKYKNNETLSDMVIKCCSQEKTYSKYFGVIGEKLCSINKKWHDIFVKQFKHYYSVIHQFETNSLRNIGKLFGHLFASDKLSIDKSWDEIKLTETDTNSASRILIKFIFQEMVEELGINEVKERLIDDDYIKPMINGIFPVVNATWESADHLRFSINFFTAIGLGVLTEEMREVLKSLPPPPVEERGRSRSRGESRSRSYSRSYSRSRSRSYSRSSYSRSYSRSRSRSYSRSRSNSLDSRRSISYSRSPSPRGRSYARSKTPSRSPRRIPSRHRKHSQSPSTYRKSPSVHSPSIANKKPRLE